VANRGIARRPLFESRSDQRYFLAQLARQVRAGRIEVHAFCILTTHYHLLLRSVRGELGEAMRLVQKEYSRRFNRLRMRDGPLVRGRYFSRRIDSERYFRVLVRYIDVNPVQAGLAERPEDYEFGSARSYLGDRSPRWLNRSVIAELLSRGSNGDRATHESYRALYGIGGGEVRADLVDLVESQMLAPGSEASFDDLIGQAPSRVRSWMLRKARLADGCRPGAPICTARTILIAMREYTQARGTWMVEVAGRSRDGVQLARLGLLTDLCGWSIDRTAASEQSTRDRVRALRRQHQQALQDSPTHAMHTSSIASFALRLQYGSQYGSRYPGGVFI
jgi:REP element-mobilizing transposase RayT